MVRAITMPKLGQSEEEAAILRWVKKEGDAVVPGDILFEIETDKAILEVESFFEGTLLKVVVPEGRTVPVQSVVGFIGSPGEPIPEVTAPAAPREAAEPGPAPKQPRAEARPVPAAGPGKARIESTAAREPETRLRAAPVPPPGRMEAPGFLRISPRAAQLARESGIDPSPIQQGTGPGGRVVERDVRAYLEANGYDRIRVTPAAKRLAAKEKIDLLTLARRGDSRRITVADIQTAVAERPQPLSRMRRAIAARLTHSFATAPHFLVTVSVDMTDLASLRAEWKAQGKSYTLTGLILKAAALSLLEFPDVNSATDGKNVWWHSKVHLGLAVSLDQGLVVPVIRDADQLTLEEIHERATELTGKARAGKLAPEEMTGSTFTISNMGMLDVENFTAIINPGESAILAVSSVLKQPVVRNGEVVIRAMMKMTLSSDHRLIDGALAARFLNAIKNKLEETNLWKRLA